MALKTYREKRNFKASPEPTGGKPDIDKLRFVIQKHDASRLHYDFRLEMKGVLKSWAVPKGPSTDPDVKRLAMMVEDHPYDYRNFEGIIPGGYGAGTVIVWDEGFYELAKAEGKDKETQDKELRSGLKAGKLHVVLHGKKLKGEYALVKTNGKAENAWLLFKVKDKYVSKEDITLKDRSVISGKTLAQIEAKPTRIYGEDKVKNTTVESLKEDEHKERPGVNTPTAKTKVAKEKVSSKDSLVKSGKTSRFPSGLLPMLATSLDKPFDQDGWQYEIKWDGYRALAFCNGSKVELKSRNDKSFTDKFEQVYKAIQQWGIQAVVDGEIVMLTETGKADFGGLQNWLSSADGELYYYVFDLLWLNGRDLMQNSLRDRRNLLKALVPKKGNIRFSDNYDVSGIDLFETVQKMGLEGIMAKKSDSIYVPGNRSKNWCKIKSNKRQEMVIGGYTKNNGSSKAFSSLLLGVYDEGNLIYTGKVGTGFSDKQQTDMLKQFKPYIVKTSPFAATPDIHKTSSFQRPTDATAIWMKPELVCEVSFTEMTADGVMRHPSFEAMRNDKKAKEVVKEIKLDTKTIVHKELQPKKGSKTIASTTVNTFFTSSEKTQVKKINGHEIKFSNLSKLYWPDEKITKRDMLTYYHQVAPYILPYLKDRPQSMNRHPDGIHGESFYFKDVSGTAPEWVETFEYKSEADDRVRKYLVAKDEASLLYMANLGCIEMNPWHSKVKSEDFPDWCIIDLDPAAKQTFEKVIEAAIVTRDVLEGLGVLSYPKTSGSTGIHIYIPLGAKYSYDQSKEFARVIATMVQREIPRFTSIERIVKARGGKLYIDFLQNRPQATVAAPYSVRPKPGATVSMPLLWDEVKKGLKMSEFTIYNALERIQGRGDIFKPVLGKGVDLGKVVEAFSNNKK